jgi:hypothetical protein
MKIKRSSRAIASSLVHVLEATKNADERLPGVAADCPTLRFRGAVNME